MEESQDKETTNIRVVKDRFDMRNLHLPTVTIASIIIFCVWITWSASTERSNIQIQLTEISNKVSELTTHGSKIDELSVISSKRLDMIENKLTEDEKTLDNDQKKLGSTNLDDIRTNRNHLIWCLETQISNPGWKCIDLPSDTSEMVAKTLKNMKPKK